MRRLHLTAALAALMLILRAGPAGADGGFMPPVGWEVYEPGQVAVLDHDAEAGVERLSILPKFLGDATDFAWVVPVPALPEIAEEDIELFRQFGYLTRPVQRSRDGFWNCDETRYDLTGVPYDSGVAVVDEQVVGIYRTMTLSADDAEALVDSLETWGFLHDENRETAVPLLEDYVADGWYFVTMTVDSSAVAEVLEYGMLTTYAPVDAPVDAPWYSWPALQPISFTFAAAEPIYPLRISALSTREANEVYLYVAAAHRVTFPGARTFYANRISAGELAAIGRRYPLAAERLAEGVFLTKLFRSFALDEMTGDLVLEPVPDDEFLPVSYSGLPVWSVLLPGSVLVYLGWRRRRRVSPAS